MIAILRRIDKDGDGNISYEELVEAISPLDSAEVERQQRHEISEQKAQEELARSQRSAQFGSHRQEETQGFNSSKSGNVSFKQSKGPEELRSTLKKSIMGELKRDQSTTIKKEGDLLEGLLKVLREMVYLEREVEVAKEDLALKSDFNLFDAFRVFDKEGAGTISAGEVELGLNDLGIYPSKDQLYLLVRKFDRDSDTVLK